MKTRKSFTKINNFLAGLLLTAVLSAGSGLSYTVHFCHGNRSGFVLYPEITHSVAGCGCEKNEPGLKLPARTYAVTINKSDCCKNLHFFQKITTVSLQQFRPEPAPFFKLIPAATSLDLSLYCPVNPIEIPAAEASHPPPLTGKTLVFFLSQLRIPSFSGDCC